MRTAKICHDCSNYRPNKSTCKLFLPQTKFPTTHKFRKKCSKFGKSILNKIFPSRKLNQTDQTNQVSPECPDLKTPLPYFMALKCYDEYVKHHASYTAVLDFSIWCREQIDLYTPKGEKCLYKVHTPVEST